MYQYSTIIDVGCGNGDVTRVLSKSFPNANIIGIDTSADMINYATDHNQEANIEYVLQDISVNWEKLDTKITRYDGKTDLIFINHELNWVVDDRETAIGNFSRLLSLTGRLYSNTYLIRDIFQFLPSEQQEKYSKVIKILSPDEQVEMWQRLFYENGLPSVNCMYGCRKFVFKEDCLNCKFIHFYIFYTDMLFTAIKSNLFLS